MKFILGEKQVMSQKFAPDGTVIPVTAVVAGPCVVVQVKTADKDGYKAVQVGFGRKKNINKPMRGHLKDLGSFSHLREFRLDDSASFNVGDTITTAVFEPKEVIKVVGTSKGKGFQGVVKRHGFAGQKATHGHKDQLRMPGTSGMGGVQHVFKGKKMGGRMGGDQITVSNLEIVEIDAENNIVYIKGAVPGRPGSLVEIVAPGEMTLQKPVEAVAESAEPVVEEAATEVSEAPVEAAPVAETTEAPAEEPKA